MNESDWTKALERVQRGAEAISTWVREHREEIDAFVTWYSVLDACERAGLYAPMDPDSWRAIRDAGKDESKSDAEVEELIVSLYGPGGPGFNALRDEINQAQLLGERNAEVVEVLNALEEGKDYLAICGALPLVEYVLSNAAGKWQHPHKQPISDRVFKEGALTADEEAHLLIYGSAVEMLRTQIDEVWKPGPQRVGSVVKDLNRNLVLHGTALGWSTPENATRVTLLLAAACQVAEPLLGPRPAPTSNGNSKGA